MTDTRAAPRRGEARALQIKLYREIGVAAVAAALLAPAQPEASPEVCRPAEVATAAPPRHAA